LKKLMILLDLELHRDDATKGWKRRRRRIHTYEDKPFLKSMKHLMEWSGSVERKKRHQSDFYERKRNLDLSACPTVAIRCFHRKDLDFIARIGTFVDLEEMEPEDNASGSNPLMANPQTPENTTLKRKEHSPFTDSDMSPLQPANEELEGRAAEDDSSGPNHSQSVARILPFGESLSDTENFSGPTDKPVLFQSFESFLRKNGKRWKKKQRMVLAELPQQTDDSNQQGNYDNWRRVPLGSDDSERTTAGSRSPG